MTDVLPTVAIVLSALALFARRRTWGHRWYAAATVNVLLQSIYTLLMHGRINRLVTHSLHALTNLWNFEELIGSQLCIAGFVITALCVLSRLEWDDGELARFVTLRVLAPILILMFAMCGLFIKAMLDHPAHMDTLMDVTLISNGWLSRYWDIYAITSLYLVCVSAWGYWIVARDDARSRMMCRVYIAVLSISALFSLIVLVDASSGAAWIVCRFEVIGYAVAATISWVHKSCGIASAARSAGVCNKSWCRLRAYVCAFTGLGCRALWDELGKFGDSLL